jgi:hypothetical protein
MMTTLVEKIKHMMKEYEVENGPIRDDEYEKIFVHFYLMYKDQYLEESVKSNRSDGKRRR